MWPLLCWGVLERKTTAVLDRFRKGHVEKAASLFVYVRYLLFIDFDPILKFCKEYFKKKKNYFFDIKERISLIFIMIDLIFLNFNNIAYYLINLF